MSDKTKAMQERIRDIGNAELRWAEAMGLGTDEAYAHFTILGISLIRFSSLRAINKDDYLLQVTRAIHGLSVEPAKGGGNETKGN